MYNDGKNYESFVAQLQQTLINSELVTTQKNINIELNKKIKDNCGTEREFDLYWEYELGGIKYKTVIECKDYNSSISVEKIDALIGKIRDIPDLKAVFATKKGYQKGAKEKAQHNKIELLVVRRPNDSDWNDENGDPLIRTISINLQFCPPAQIIKFTPEVDANWIEKHTNIDTTKPINFDTRNDKVTIEDHETNNSYTLLELGGTLTEDKSIEHGKSITKKEVFKNAFINCDGLKLKLNAYTVKYLLPEPVKKKIEIDLSKGMLGVIEYLSKGSKTSIYKNGKTREQLMPIQNKYNNLIKRME